MLQINLILKKESLLENPALQDTITEWEKSGAVVRLCHKSEEKTVQPDLVISDDPEVCHAFQEQETAVIVYLGKTPREGDFFDFPYAVTQIEGLDFEYIWHVWQRYQGQPWEICRTQRCLIRESTVADVDVFYRIYQELRGGEFLDKLYDNKELERKRMWAYIRNVYEFYGYGLWTVCLQDREQEIIGRAGIYMRDGYEVPELGYMIATPYQQQGYAEEVCRELISYARDKLCFDQLQAHIDKKNTGSIHLCEKLGFVPMEEGKLTQSSIRYKKDL